MNCVVLIKKKGNMHKLAYICQMINIKFEDILKNKFYPIFVLDKQTYYRYEKNGYLTIRVRHAESTNYKILNPMAVYMCSLMDGKTDAKKILDTLVEKYGNELKVRISKDLKDLIIQGWMLGFIKWKGENPMEKYGIIDMDNGFEVKIAFDEDTTKLMKFFAQKNIKIYRSFRFDMGDTEPLLLRHNLFMMNYLYFMIYKNNKLLSVIIIDVSTRDSACTVLYIETIETIEIDDLKQIFKKITENINVYSVKKCNVIKVYVEKGKDVRQIFENIGFKYIVTLPKEYKSKDIDLLEIDLGV